MFKLLQIVFSLRFVTNIRFNFLNSIFYSEFLFYIQYRREVQTQLGCAVLKFTLSRAIWIIKVIDTKINIYNQRELKFTEIEKVALFLKHKVRVYLLIHDFLILIILYRVVTVHDQVSYCVCSLFSIANRRVNQAYFKVILRLGLHSFMFLLYFKEGLQPIIQITRIHRTSKLIMRSRHIYTYYSVAFSRLRQRSEKR